MPGGSLDLKGLPVRVQTKRLGILVKPEDEQDEGHDFPSEHVVFNVEQLEGLPSHFYTAVEPPALDKDIHRVETATFIKATRARIDHGGSRAFYSAREDRIQLPPPECFSTPESYHAAAIHELTHWTGHPRRLAREFRAQGSAREELVADLSSAFLAADLGITPAAEEEFTYIETWIEVLKEDVGAAFTIAAEAQRAADFLHGLQPAPRRWTVQAPEHPKETGGPPYAQNLLGASFMP